MRPWAIATGFTVVMGLASGQAFGADLVKNIDGINYTLIDVSSPDSPSQLHFNGRLYIPPSYDGSQPIPVVTFLHGLGEKGTNNESQINGNMYNLLKQARTLGFMVYAPQANGWWTNQDLTVRTLGKLSTQYNIDPSRLYMTGLSSGGQGTMYGIQQYSDLFAGFVPLSVAGNPIDTPALAVAAVGKPIWFWAGENDSGPASNSRTSVTNILQAEGVSPLPSLSSSGGYTYISADGQLRYTQVAGAGHDNSVWNNGAYATSSPMYSWLLGQSNPITKLAPGETVRLALVNDNNIGTTSATDSGGNVWNRASGYSVQTSSYVVQAFAQDKAGLRTTTTFSVSSPFYSRADVTLPDGAPYDQSIAGNAWTIYTYQPLYNHGQITIEGLTPGGEYDMGLFASLVTTDLKNYIGVYSVGAQSVTINAANNITEYTLYGLLADSAGKMVLDVNLSGTSQRAYLNTISLTAVPEPGAIMGVLGLIGVLTRRRRR